MRERPFGQSENSSEIILYQTEDGRTRIEVRLEDESVWLTQMMMAELYQTSVPNINMHIRNIFEDHELPSETTVKEYLTVRSEGLREVTRPGRFYNLEMILAVGYRVRSHRGVQFRRWATERLRAKLDAFLKFNEREILDHAGKISMEAARALALDEYEKFNMRRLADEARRETLADDGFDKTAKLVEGHAKQRKRLAAEGRLMGKGGRKSGK